MKRRKENASKIMEKIEEILHIDRSRYNVEMNNFQCKMEKKILNKQYS